jgi:membrane-associated phospholipid phosphatase
MNTNVDRQQNGVVASRQHEEPDRRRHAMTAAAHVMFERRIHALVAGLALLAIAVALTILVAVDPTNSPLQPIDDRWLSWMVELRTPWLTALAKVMSVLGGPLVMVPARLGIIGALAWTRRWLQLAAFVGATICSELCIGPLKALIDRPRPPGSLISTSSSSFPSGHAIAASVTAIGLVVVLVPASRRVRWTIAAATFAAVMATSRTYLAAHWLSDVIAGACLGTGIAVVWSAALELFRARRQAGPQVPSSGTRSPGTAVLLRVVSGVLVSTGLACVLALHVLRDDLTPTGHRLSEYATGPYGALMTTAFASVGAGLITFAWALSRAGQRHRRWSRSVPIAVAAAGVGMVVAGIYRTEPDRVGSMSELVHSRTSALATLALMAAAVTWSIVGRDAASPSWRFDTPATLALAAAVIGAVSPLLHHSGWTGLSQRALWATLLAWMFVTVWQLSSVTTAPASVPEKAA